MRNSFFVLLLLAASLLSRQARGDDQNGQDRPDYEKACREGGYDDCLHAGGFQLELGGNVGASVIEYINHKDHHTRTVALNIFGRLRNEHTPIGLELSLTLLKAQGVSAVSFVDVLHGKYWRIHSDVGLMVPVQGQYLSESKVDRSWDLILGLGAEVKFGRISLTADWRMFFPDPPTVIKQYGDFVRPIYSAAQREGHLCLGAAWLF